MALTTTAKVKTYLGISSSGDDTLIGDLIANAQSIIESHTGRVFDVSGDTTKKFDARLDVDGRKLYFSDQLEIAAAPTTVTNGDGSTLSADTDFVYLPRNRFPAYCLVLLPSSSAWWQGDSDGNDATAISIAAKWGYSVSGSVPADIQQACIRLTAFLYRQRETNSDGDRPLIVDGVTILPSALPRDVTRILSPYIMRAY